MLPNREIMFLLQGHGSYHPWLSKWNFRTKGKYLWMKVWLFKKENYWFLTTVWFNKMYTGVVLWFKLFKWIYNVNMCVIAINRIKVGLSIIKIHLLLRIYQSETFFHGYWPQPTNIWWFIDTSWPESTYQVWSHSFLRQCVIWFLILKLSALMTDLQTGLPKRI